MALSNPRPLFSQRWVDSLKAVPESAMIATITVYTPGTRTYDPNTDSWTDTSTPVYTGPARVQPLRSAIVRPTDGNDADIQTFLFSIPIAYIALDLRPGMHARVVTSPLNPSLVGYDYEVVEGTDSTNPIEKTFYCTVNAETQVTS